MSHYFPRDWSADGEPLPCSHCGIEVDDVDWEEEDYWDSLLRWVDEQGG